MEIDNDEAVVAVEGGDEIGEVVVGNIGAELAIELVHGFSRQRVVIDGLDGGADLIREEKVAFPVAQIILKHFVSPVAGTAAGAQLPGLGVLALLLHDLRRAGDEDVVVGTTGKGRGFRRAFGLAEDADERLGDGFPLGIDPE